MLIWIDVNRFNIQHITQKLSTWLKACDSQGSCTTTPRRTTVPSTWRVSATCSPLCPCSWSRWLSAGRPGTNWLKTRKRTAARPKAASPPTASGTASCRKNTRERPPVSKWRTQLVVLYLGPLTFKTVPLGHDCRGNLLKRQRLWLCLRRRRCDFIQTKPTKTKYCCSGNRFLFRWASPGPF